MSFTKNITFLLFALLIGFGAEAQVSSDTTAFQVVDSAKIENQERGTNEAIDSLFIREEETARKNIPKIGLLLNQIVTKAKNYSIEMGRLNLILRDRPDYTTLDSRIPTLRQTAVDLEKVILDNQEEANNRFLNGVENFLNYFQNEQENLDEIVNKRLEDLIDVGNRLDEIRQDSIMSLTLKNREILPEIDDELKLIQSEIKRLDSALISQELEIATYQAKIADLSIQFLNLRQFFRESERSVQRRSWNKEVNYLWEPETYSSEKSYNELYSESFTTNQFVFVRYLTINRTYLLISFGILLFVYILTRITIRRVETQKEFADQILGRIGFLKKNLFISCTIAVIPFVFTFIDNPTIVFGSLISLVFVTFSGFVAKDRLPKRVFTLWLVFFPFYLLSPTMGLAWGTNYDERYFDLIAAIAGIVLAFLMLRETSKNKFSGSNVIRYLSIFLLCFSLFSLGLNVFGRVSLAKTYVISGISNFYRGIALFLFVQIILKLVYIWLEASKKESDVLTSFFDFQEIQQRVESVVNVFAAALWFYSVTYYLGFFNPIFDSVQSFLVEPRTLGNLEYEFSTILLFFIILIATAFVANNIAYFASVFDQKSGSSRNKRLGSSILLIRLGIIMIGLFIAMAAAKIPLDKITIVLGALSVGIGFGLQTIINNLVSGIILAFERPVQIGDNIQVGELLGTVQEVGIRASKIRAYDGSEIILPNGDLLSQSLINWTLSDKRRRIELIIGVGYGSDMVLVNQVLEDVLDRERVLKNPPAKVFMQEFGDNSVNFRLLFWVENMDIWLEMRSEVMNAIFSAFKDNNIEIPFPQRDLYLKSVPNNLENIAEALEVKEAILAPKDLENEGSSEEVEENKPEEKDNKKPSKE